MEFEREEVRREALGLRILLVFSAVVTVVTVGATTASGIAVVVVLVSWLLIGGVAWVRMPKLAAKNLEAAHRRALRPRPTRRGVRYRTAPEWSVVFAALALLFAALGLLALLARDTGGVVLLAAAVAHWWVSGAGTVWLSDDVVVVRTLCRFRSWELESIAEVRATKLPLWPAPGEAQRLELTMSDGRHFRSGFVFDASPIRNHVFELTSILRTRLAEHRTRDASRSSG